MTDSADVKRSYSRTFDQLRPVHIEIGPMKFADGSALIQMGDTRVLVSASVEKRVPGFLAGSGRGWATAEYAMLPRATSTRSTREVSRGRPSGRSSEIQRLIGRSLRAVLNLDALPERTLTLDCDVLQADGGTRTASITAAYVATVDALSQLFLAGDLSGWPLLQPVVAVSVGIVKGVSLLDLDASEDQTAEVDMNVVGTPAGKLIEVQGTAEGNTFSRLQLDQLLDLAQTGIDQLAKEQEKVLRVTLQEVNSVLGVLQTGRRKSAEPKEESTLWKKPAS